MSFLLGKTKQVLITTFMLSILGAIPAVAQELEEIVVTAQKREQNLQSVPIAVSAFSGDAIVEVGATDMFDLQSNVPGLVVSQNQTATTSNFNIRGVGTSSQNFGLESSVGLYVDGVYRSRQSAMINELVDLAAIEVLRGPQGTLFGKNTPSGAVLMRTRAPGHERDGYIEASVGNYGLTSINAAASFSAVPDELAFRFAGFATARDGYVDDANFGEEVINDRARYGFRAQALWEPNDRLSARVIADYSQIDEICCAAPTLIDGIVANARPGPVPGPDSVLLALGGTVFETGSFFENEVALDVLPVSENEDAGLSLELNYDFDALTFTSVSGYRAFDSTDFIDSDFSDVDLLKTQNVAEQSSFSQEFRITSEGDNFTYVLGVYYFTQDIDNEQLQLIGPGLDPFIAAALGLDQITGGLNLLNQLTGGALPTAATAFPVGTAVSTTIQEHESYAAFGQADWNVNDRLTLTFGLRYTNEEKTLLGTFVQDANGPPPDLGAIGLNLGLAAAGQPFDATTFAPAYVPGWGYYLFDPLAPRPDLDVLLEEDQVTGTFKISYAATDDLLVYASYGKGYKSGGTNTDRINQAFNPVFNAEIVDSVEVGFKADFPDQALRLNVAAHVTDVDDFQTNSFTGTGFNLQNAATLDTYGAEVELYWAPSDTVTVRAAYAKTVADYGEFLAGNCWVAFSFHTGQPDPGRENPTDGFCNRSGGRVSTNPEDFFSTTLRKDFNMDNGVSLFALGEFVYVGDQSMDGNNDPLKFQDSYNLVNIRFGVNFPDQDIDVTLWGRNIFDEEYYGTNFDVPAQDGRLNAYSREPATFGLTLRKHFN
ncbi:MAG: TonB-dependent receptor [Pseudomonadota bacterium]